MQNPADLSSRGCSVKTLKKVRWWKGPYWLKNSTEDWPKSELFPDMEVINSEKKKTIITAAATQREEKYYLRFSSYGKLVRITTWIKRFLTNLKKTKDQRITGDLQFEEIKIAERALLKQVQMDAFNNEEDKRLSPFQIVKDSDGILRLKTKVFLKDDHKDFRLPIIHFPPIIQ
ncbi:uncharacterized protein TNCV_866001 [Trichonephila clavipes]|nr:uncharacterized protein TNCV_866001 [Trichonephila clavipes]